MTTGMDVRATRTRFTDWAVTALAERAFVVSVHQPLDRRMAQV